MTKKIYNWPLRRGIAFPQQFNSKEASSNKIKVIIAGKTVEIPNESHLLVDDSVRQDQIFTLKKNKSLIGKEKLSWLETGHITESGEVRLSMGLSPYQDSSKMNSLIIRMHPDAIENVTTMVIDLWPNEPKDVNIAALGSFINLQRLEVHGLKLSDLSFLSKLQFLTVLHLKNCTIKKVENPDLGITNLSKIPGLKILDISHSQIEARQDEFEKVHKLLNLARFENLGFKYIGFNDLGTKYGKQVQ